LNQSFPTSKSTNRAYGQTHETGEKKSRPEGPTFWENLKCAGMFYQKEGAIARLKPVKALEHWVFTGPSLLYIVVKEN
jgi:hypothetical protein